MKLLRFVSILVLLLAGGTVGAGAAVATPSHDGGRQGRHSGGRHHGHHGAGGTYTCTGGDIPPGTYASVHVSGVCFAPTGTIVVRRDLTVEADALLDATTPGDPSAGNPQLPAAVTVGGDVRVGSGGVLLLGCSPYISCPTAVTHDQVGGSVEARDALGVVLHSVAVRGDVSIVGGGGGTSTCATIPPLWLADPALANGEGPGNAIPVYTDTEDVAIGGNLTVAGVQSCWLGSLRDEIGGSARFTHDTLGDPDAMEIANNVVGGDLSCYANSPAVQWGDTSASPNIVGRSARGECAFGVVLPNPPPSGLAEHISVSAWSLPAYRGSHTQTSGTSTVVGTTVSGDVLSTGSYAVDLAGAGLTGSVPEHTFATTAPDGCSTFYALDSGTMAFGGHSGTVMVLAHGTTSASGRTRGTFLVISGGTASGALGTLAGYGTFTSRGQPAGTLRLVEHLRIT